MENLQENVLPVAPSVGVIFTEQDKAVLLNLVRGVGREGTAIAQVFADGRVSGFGEGMTLLASCSNLVGLIQDGKKNLIVYKSLPIAEREQVAAELGEALNIGSAELDAKVDRTLVLLARIESSVETVLHDVQAFRSVWGV